MKNRGYAVLAAIAVLLCACGAAAGAQSAPDKIKWVAYGDQSARMKEFLSNELKDRLKKDLNLELEIVYLPWSEYGGGKTSLMLATGEDMMTFFGGDYIAKGLCADVTDLVPKYMPSYFTYVDKETYDSFAINGRNYRITIGNKPAAAQFYPFMVRQDLLDEVGMKSLATAADIESFYAKVKAKHPDYRGIDVNRATVLQTMLMYSSSSRNWFSLDTNITDAIWTDESEKGSRLYDYFELPEYKKLCAITSRWYQMGILDMAVITNPTQLGADWDVGKVMMRPGNMGGPTESNDLMKAVPKAELVNYFVDAGNRPKIGMGTQATDFIVSKGAKKPENYLRFINWMQSSQDVVDFLVYGVKGRDYALKGDRVVAINKDELFYSWMLWNVNFVRYTESVNDRYISAVKRWNDNAVKSKTFGFAFDAAPVKGEIAKITAVVQEYFNPITLGAVGYAEKYPEALRRLKAAGIDAYLAEYQRQFDAWGKTRK